MLKFTTELKQEPVEIDGRELILRELTGSQADQYETSLVTIGDDSKPIIHRENVKAKLLHVCLLDPDGTSAYGSIEEVGALPSRIVNELYEKARQMSGLDDNAVETAKND